MVFGYFNAILYSIEKCGVLLKGEREMEDFHYAKSDYRLVDLGCLGGYFTWDKRRKDSDNICQRLDRFCANTVRCDILGSSCVYHGTRDSSDHCLVILRSQLFPGTPNPGKRMFPIEPMLLANEGCSKVIQLSWFGGLLSANTTSVSQRICWVAVE